MGTSIDIKVPSLGESVSEAFIGKWLKNDGDAVKTDELVLELETDKANAQIAAPQAGTLRIARKDGTVKVGEVVARVEEGATKPAAPAKKQEGESTKPVSKPIELEIGPLKRDEHFKTVAALEASAEVSAKAVTSRIEKPAAPPAPAASTHAGLDMALSPAMRKRMREQGTEIAQAIAAAPAAPAAPAAAPKAAAPKPAPEPVVYDANGESKKPMTRLRKRIAERLLDAQRSAAILTTFNEVDMGAIMEMRARLKDGFKEKHGVGLGFMSFFARACVLALRDMPVVGGEIRGDDVITRDHVHLGVAVSTERGLVVPVVRHAEVLGFADLEREIARMAGLARDQKLSPDDLQGGTFSITNGGVFGSLLSTPILNPPQSAILGMHKIEDRPVVKEVGGKKEIVIRPMMYVALSYDHRLIDGKDSVTFLVKVKERLEDPARLLLEV